MHDYVRAIILGVIQGLSEFLPISSSGHLVLAPSLLGGASSLTFDVGLHVGTLAAAVIYFWREFWDIVTAMLRTIARSGAKLSSWDWQARLGAWIILGTIPAVVAGALFDSFIEANVRQAWLVGAFLLGFGLLLGIADRVASRRPSGEENVGASDSLIIGVAQAIALLPGVSRAGITITAALFLGFDRVTATRFSFLLSVPAIAGAAVLTLTKAALHHEPLDVGVMLTGAITSAVIGAIVIHFLLRYLSTHSLRPFVIYRVALGLLVIALSGRI